MLGHQIEIRATRTEFERRQGILFVGALYEDNTPNTESMVWFIDEVMPRLKERFQADGNLHLDLVGHCKAPAILERQAPILSRQNSLLSQPDLRQVCHTRPMKQHRAAFPWS